MFLAKKNAGPFETGERYTAGEIPVGLMFVMVLLAGTLLVAFVCFILKWWEEQDETGTQEEPPPSWEPAQALLTVPPEAEKEKKVQLVSVLCEEVCETPRHASRSCGVPI